MSPTVRGFIYSLMLLGILFTGHLNHVQSWIVIVGTGLSMGTDLVVWQVWLRKRRKKRADCGCPTPCN